MLREETEVFSGIRPSRDDNMTDISAGEQLNVSKSDVWSNFYDKVGDIYTFHERYNSAALIDE